MSRKKTGKISTLGSQITSIISVALVLFIIGLLGMLSIASGRLSASLLGNVSVIIKVDSMASAETQAGIGNLLRAKPYAAQVKYTPADEVLAQEMEHNAEILEILSENPYQPEYEVILMPGYVDGDSIANIVNSLMLMEGIDEVVSQVDMVKAVTAATSKATLVLSCIGIVLLVISLVLIYNTVSIAVYSRRFVIRTMQLVGATSGFIRKPFVTAGIAWGAIAAILASGMLIALQCYADSLGLEISLTLPAQDMSIVCAALLLIGMLICAIAAYCATTRYLRASYDKLYAS